MKNIFKFILAVAIPELVGAVSGFITFDSIKNWYSTLNKPGFNPPNFVFGPVWTFLYFLMGVSLYMILKEPASPVRKKALFIFGLQLFLNFWWSIIFFSFHRPDIAIADIACLWISIVAMIVLFRQLKPVAGYLQIPYLLWVSFATALNIAIYMLN